MINIIQTKFKEVKIIEPEVFNDKRGYFFESFNHNLFNKYVEKINFIQDNQSKSKYGVFRGFHFQKPPYEQSKLVRVVKGEIQDIIVDIRKDSKTYLDHISINISEKNNIQLFVPKGFAHGFLVLSKDAIVQYKVDCKYMPEYESIISYKDKRLDIGWQIEEKFITVSEKDKVSKI